MKIMIKNTILMRQLKFKNIKEKLFHSSNLNERTKTHDIKNIQFYKNSEDYNEEIHEVIESKEIEYQKNYSTENLDDKKSRFDVNITALMALKKKTDNDKTKYPTKQELLKNEKDNEKEFLKQEKLLMRKTKIKSKIDVASKSSQSNASKNRVVKKLDKDKTKAQNQNFVIEFDHDTGSLKDKIMPVDDIIADVGMHTPASNPDFIKKLNISSDQKSNQSDVNFKNSDKSI